MPDKKFTLEDSDRMIKDVIDRYFQGLNDTRDIEELGEIEAIGEEIQPIEGVV